MSTVPAAPVAAPLASIPDFPPDTASVPRPQRNTCAPPRAPVPNDEFTLDDIELGVLAGDDEPWDTWCVAPSHHRAPIAGTPELGESSNLVSSLTSPHLRNPAEHTADGLFTDMLGESEPSSPYGTRQVPQKRYLKTKGGGLKIKGGWTPEEDAHLLR